MIDSFDNPQLIAQKFNELQQALQNPNIIAHFGKIDPISHRFKSQNSDHINYINWEKIQHYFVEGRKLMPLSFPQTNLDALIYQILNTYYDVSVNQLDQAYTYHLQAMAAENSIGLLLERFIASVLEPIGWIWCSGSAVRAVDFIEPYTGILLQIKNRDNSENSSSSAIRQGSHIIKWFRLYSKKPGVDNWASFPLPENQKDLTAFLNEGQFLNFATKQLEQLKTYS